jgi:hypothetical protein
MTSATASPPCRSTTATVHRPRRREATANVQRRNDLATVRASQRPARIRRGRQHDLRRNNRHPGRHGTYGLTVESGTDRPSHAFGQHVRQGELSDESARFASTDPGRSAPDRTGRHFKALAPTGERAFRRGFHAWLGNSPRNSGSFPATRSIKTSQRCTIVITDRVLARCSRACRCSSEAA